MATAGWYEAEKEPRSSRLRDKLVTHLRTIPRMRDAPTTVGQEITIDYAGSTLTVDGKSFPFPPLSPAAQELIVAGGAENLVASRFRRGSAGE